MVLKLTSCEVFGMLPQYWLSSECGFIFGERVNPVGVLVSVLLSGVAAGGHIAPSCDFEAVLCDSCCFDGCCCKGC